jgi:putative aldouronate transport system permease protein
MNAGFEQIFVMYNPTVYETADIIDTFVYRLTFVGAPDYGLGAAVGIFKSVINFLLLFVADRIAKLVDKDSGIF